MNAQRYSSAYTQHRMKGPFLGRIDPWAEAGRYFKQVHAGMIGELLEQIQEPLLAMGYEAGREVSLQITDQREPDIHVRREQPFPFPPTWDYAVAAVEILAEPGVAVDWEEPELDALYVRELESGELVTIVEIISPSNKIEREAILDYRARRDRLVRQGVNVMEIDLTRSVKRLLEDKLAATFAYHIAVYLPLRLPRLVGVDFGQPLKRVALPLRAEVLPMELQTAYEHAYQQASIAGQIYREGHYTEEELPFPSLLDGRQRREALDAVAAWKAELERLRAG